MLDDIIANKGLHNIFIFPEIEHTLKEFLISKVVFDINEGRINKIYNPQGWEKGQILNFEGCIAEFEKVDYDKNGNIRIWVKFAADTIALPIEIAPFFQKCDSNKRLSKW